MNEADGAPDQNPMELDGDSPLVVLVPARLETEAITWDAMIGTTPKPKALVLNVNATGSLPNVFQPKIAAAVRDGVAVFLLGDARVGTGPTTITYGIQEEALNAGAVHLESANFGSFERAMLGQSSDPKDNVIKYINRLAQRSASVFDLMRRVRDEYRLPDREISGWSNKRDVLTSRRKLDAMIDRLEAEATKVAA